MYFLINCDFVFAGLDSWYASIVIGELLDDGCLVNVREDVWCTEKDDQRTAGSDTYKNDELDSVNH